MSELNSLAKIWALQDSKLKLMVQLGKDVFHVKQKTRLDGYILEDGKGASYYIRDSAAKPIWRDVSRYSKG